MPTRETGNKANHVVPNGQLGRESRFVAKVLEINTGGEEGQAQMRGSANKREEPHKTQCQAPAGSGASQGNSS